MGVTKILMASNDTLFNFEDTLGDDVFSSRNSSHSDCNTTGSNTPQPSSACCTPVNDILSNVSSAPYGGTDEKPSLLPLDLKSAVFGTDDRSPTNAFNELLSPEQAQTFSEDINTVELISSELSGTMDVTTNTLDDLKTCIFVHIKHDDDVYENNPASGSASDRTEPSSAEVHLNSDLNSAEVAADGNHRIESNRVEQQNDFLANERRFSSLVSSPTDSDSIGSSSKENENPNEQNEHEKSSADFNAKTSFGSVLGRNVTEALTSGEKEVSVRATISVSDSSKTIVRLQELPIADIKFSGPGAKVDAGNEWESDVDNSNSSEEFMYVPGPHSQTDLLSDRKLDDIDNQIDINNVWNSHKDRIAVAEKGMHLPNRNRCPSRSIDRHFACLNIV